MSNANRTIADTELWLVTKVGVYDHGVCYVAETEADALRFTHEYAPDEDGYHEWRIDPIKIGVPTGDETFRVNPPTKDQS